METTSNMLKSPMDLAKSAWQAFTKRWKFFVLYTLASSIVPGLIIFVGMALVGLIGIAGAATIGGTASLIISGVLALVVYLAGIYVSLMFMSGFFMAVANEQMNNIRETVRQGKPRAFPLFLVALGVGLYVALGFILLIVPGVYLAVCYAFAQYNCVLEKQDGWAAATASKALVTGRWMAVFGRMVAMLVGLWLVIALPVALLSAIRLAPLAMLWQVAVSIISGPVVVIYMYQLYMNLKQTQGSSPVTPVAPVQV